MERSNALLLKITITKKMRKERAVKKCNGGYKSTTQPSTFLRLVVVAVVGVAAGHKSSTSLSATKGFSAAGVGKLTLTTQVDFQVSSAFCEKLQLPFQARVSRHLLLLIKCVRAKNLKNVTLKNDINGFPETPLEEEGRPSQRYITAPQLAVTSPLFLQLENRRSSVA